MYFKDINIGSTVQMPVLVKLIDEGINVKNEPYCDILLSDGQEDVFAKLWNKAKYTLPFQKDQGIFATLKAEEYRNEKHYILLTYAPLPPNFDIGQLVRKVDHTESMLTYIVQNTQAVSKGIPRDAILPICDIVTGIYSTNWDALLYWAASKAQHHALYGGLAKHIYDTFRAGQAICQIYTTLDAEILLTGIALRNIGTILMYKTSQIGTAELSPNGGLLGRAVLSMSILDDYIAKQSAVYGRCPYNTVQLTALRHIITAESGYDVTPKTAEAITAVWLDTMDAKLDAYNNALSVTDPGKFYYKSALNTVFRFPPVFY